MGAFDCERIRSAAGIARLEFHAEIESTNTRALALVEQGVDVTPLVVLAERQQQGRGRGTNRWWAQSGAITFSLVVDPRFAALPPRNWPLVSLTTALAVAKVLERQLPAADVRIKWPNDVYVGGRKICGILVETTPRRPGSLVIGVGINVNNSLAGAPEPLPSIATSVVDISGRHADCNEILIGLLRELLAQLPKLNEDGWELADAWRQRCYLHGRTVELDTGQRVVTGVCHGIDDQGALLLLTDGGIEKCFGGVVARVL